jgi:hypothetical protein
MYMPPMSALVMGKESIGALSQPHRREASKCVQRPLESAAMQDRGAPDIERFAQLCADRETTHAVYPDEYANAYTEIGVGQKRKDR